MRAQQTAYALAHCVFLFSFNHLCRFYLASRPVAPRQKVTLNYCCAIRFHASSKSPPAVPNTRRNQFEFNLAFFEQAFVGSQLCLPYSISVISFITNWIWGSKSPSGLTGAFEIIFPLIRARLVWSGHKWWGLCYSLYISNRICQCEVTKTNYVSQWAGRGGDVCDRRLIENISITFISVGHN